MFSEEEQDTHREKEPQRNVERFEEEYWRRAEGVDQRSWQEMVHKPDRRTYDSKVSSSFFFLPGDKRLEGN